MRKKSKLTPYDWHKAIWYAIAAGLTMYGLFVQHSLPVLGMLALAVAFVAPDTPKEGEDTI